jgi:glucuronoarabinoxylan endo-1,4-beta-xylanase
VPRYHSLFVLSIMSSQSFHRAWITRATFALLAILALALVRARFWQPFRALYLIAPVTIHWGTNLQTMDGFGATQASEVALTPSEADFFFSSSGLGFSIIRTAIIPTLQDCMDVENYLSSLGYKMNPDNCQTVAFGPTNRSADILAARQAFGRGVTTVLATSSSPPGFMKSNRRYYQGGTFLGGTTNYSSLASILASFCSYAARFGVTVSHISPQNEPDQSNQYTGALWTAQQFHDFIPYLRSAIHTSSCPSARIAFPEPSSFTSNYGGFAAATMADSAVARDVGVLAMHAYGPHPVAPANRGYSQHIWQTEASGVSPPYDGSIRDGLKWAMTIHDHLTIGGVSAWLYFSLHNVGAIAVNNNEGLTDQTGNIAKRAYVIGNWSKFVRPGWHMVAVTNSFGLPTTAFQNASGTQTAIVIINQSPFRSKQTIRVEEQMGSVVIPWVTSATLNLAQQPSVAVMDGAIHYSVPAKSVVTLQSNYAIVPSFSPPAGTYSGPVKIFQNSIGAITCYTTGGTTPSTDGTTGCRVGTIYAGPIMVFGNITIKAVAGGTGYSSSTVVSASYSKP